MCGIFSWAGLSPKTFNKDKFDKLGIINETRGKHSCGVSIDGEIYLGVDGEKEYRDFIANTSIDDPVRIPSVIGHTRHATVGSHTFDNAHPFGFGRIDLDEDDSDFAFVGVHNGSLLNHKDLAKKYDIALKKKASKGNWQVDKIDSEILLEILYKTKNFKVLSDYNGAAALKWTFLDEPDVMYYYHGKSKFHKSSNVAVEERPLFYYKEGKNSLYVSSIKNSLKTIGGTEDTIGEFEHNTVYRVVNGDIDEAKTYKIARKEAFQKWGGTAVNNSTDKKKEEAGANNTRELAQNCRVHSKTEKDLQLSLNIYDETPKGGDVNKYKGRSYFSKLRYWRNGHVLNGLFTYIDGFGMYELGSTMKEATKHFDKIVNKVFIKGEFEDINLVDDEDLQIGSIPFVDNDKTSTDNLPIFPIFDGVRLKTYKDFITATTMAENGRAFDTVSLSIAAEHPILNLDYTSRVVTSQGVYENGDLCTNIVCPMGSSRIYEFKNGNLVSFETLKEKTITPEVKEVKDLIKEVEEREKEESYVTTDFIDNLIRNSFVGPLDTLRRHKESLIDYKPNQQISRALKVIEYFENSVNNLIELEEKE